MVGNLSAHRYSQTDHVIYGFAVSKIKLRGWDILREYFTVAKRKKREAFACRQSRSSGCCAYASRIRHEWIIPPLWLATDMYNYIYTDALGGSLEETVNQLQRPGSACHCLLTGLGLKKR